MQRTGEFNMMPSSRNVLGTTIKKGKNSKFMLRRETEYKYEITMKAGNGVSCEYTQRKSP